MKSVRNPLASFALVAVAAALLGFAALYSYVNLMDAFGPGYPFFSRTTNMDKWHDPTTAVVGLDIVSAVAALFLLRMARRLWHPR